eukprot:16442600-Heterocapsa_arctica.AAC.1
MFLRRPAHVVSGCPRTVSRPDGGLADCLFRSSSLARCLAGWHAGLLSRPSSPPAHLSCLPACLPAYIVVHVV